MIELQKLRILSDFKNLKGIDIDFKQGQATYVLIGNNGAGKSSILEALSAIFGSLYNSEEATGFDYAIVYNMDGHRIVISFKQDTLKIKVDGEPITLDALRSNYLPSRIICNYSGEDMRIRELYYDKPFKDYISTLATTGGAYDLKMVFIDKDLWMIILLVMLACRRSNPAIDSFLNETLGVHHANAIRIEFNTKTLVSWQPNPSVYYIRQILPFIGADGSIEVENINPNNELPMTLFNFWNGSRPLLKKLSINFNDGVDAALLSEGEKKMMVVFFILEAIADEKSIVLLDEPDSHVHVARKAELKEYFDKTLNRKNILTSHSPTLTAKFPEKSIIMLDRQPDGSAVVVDKTKQQIVAELTNNIWNLQEQNIFLASNKTVLVVEGTTDEPILEAALKTHKNAGRYTHMDFAYLPCNGASNIPTLIAKFKPKPGQMMIAFFDADGSGWDAIKEVMADGKNYPKDPFGKAKKKDNIWYTTYPVYKKGVDNFNIEDYFPRSVFLKYIMRFKALTEIWTKDRLKRNMAKDCEDGLMTDKQLEKFCHVFDRIQEIMDADTAGLDHI